MFALWLFWDLLKQNILLTPCTQDLPGTFNRHARLQDLEAMFSLVIPVCQPVRQVRGVVCLADELQTMCSKYTIPMLQCYSTSLAVAVAARAFPVSYNEL